MINEIFKKTESEIAFTSIAKDVNLSVSTVIRFFDMLAYDTPKELPQVLSIDEFKGNTTKIFDIKKEKVLAIFGDIG